MIMKLRRLIHIPINVNNYLILGETAIKKLDIIKKTYEYLQRIREKVEELNQI